MTQKPTAADPADDSALQPSDPILAFRRAACAHQQAQAGVARLRADAEALREQISARSQTAQSLLLNAHGSEVFMACEAARAEALAAQLDATMAEVSRLQPPIPGYSRWLGAYDYAKASLALRIGSSMGGELKQLLKQSGISDPDAIRAAARSVDQLYQFGNRLRPEQQGDAHLDELFQKHLALQQMQWEIDTVFGAYFPGSANLELLELDKEISDHAVAWHESMIFAHRDVAKMHESTVQSLKNKLRTTQDLLRDAERDLNDKTLAMNEARAALEQFMLANPGTVVSADAAPGDIDQRAPDPVTTTITSLASIPEEDEQDFDSSSDASTIGMVMVDTAPRFMPQQPVSAGWQDYFSPPALKASAVIALAACLLFPEDTETLFGLLGDVKSGDFSAALI